MTRLVRLLALGGLWPFFAAILVFVALRMWSMTKRRGEGKSSFDGSFLVFSTGWVSIAVVIVLMYLYETRFGSLYLHVGVISSLFMVGLTIGAAFVGRLVKMETRHSASLLLGLIADPCPGAGGDGRGAYAMAGGTRIVCGDLRPVRPVLRGLLAAWPPLGLRLRAFIPARRAAGWKPPIISGRVSAAWRRVC